MKFVLLNVIIAYSFLFNPSNKPARIFVDILASATFDNVSQNGAVYYASILSTGSIIAIACMAVIAAGGTAAVIIIVKRKKKKAASAPSQSAPADEDK